MPRSQATATAPASHFYTQTTPVPVVHPTTCRPQTSSHSLRPPGALHCLPHPTWPPETFPIPHFPFLHPRPPTPYFCARRMKTAMKEPRSDRTVTNTLKPQNFLSLFSPFPFPALRRKARPAQRESAYASFMRTAPADPSTISPLRHNANTCIIRGRRRHRNFVFL